MFWHRWRKRFREWLVSCLREARREEGQSTPVVVQVVTPPCSSLRDALESAGVSVDHVPQGEISGAQALALFREYGFEVIEHGAVSFQERPAIVLLYLGPLSTGALLQAVFVPQFTAVQVDSAARGSVLVGVVFTDPEPQTLAAKPTGTT